MNECDMNKITSVEMKNRILEMMDFVHKFCVENEITYYLTYGTLLGAVRHKGFIPWDDDLDIVMPRESYEKFIRLFVDKNARFEVVSHHKYPRYYQAFAKVIDTETVLIEKFHNPFPIGVYIDVFPLDYAGDTETQAISFRNSFSLHRKLLDAKLYIWNPKRGVLRNVISLMAFIFPIKRENLINKIDDKAQKNKSVKASNYAGILIATSYGDKEIMQSKWFGAPILLEFEGRKYYGPSEPESILKRLYGDYMQLPPEEERVPCHFFDAYIKTP